MKMKPSNDSCSKGVQVNVVRLLVETLISTSDSVVTLLQALLVTDLSSAKLEE